MTTRSRSSQIALSVLTFLLISSPLMARGNAETEAIPQTAVVIDPDPTPGSPVRVIASGWDVTAPLPAAILISGDGKKLSSAPFFKTGIIGSGEEIILALIPVPVTAVPGTAEILIEAGSPLPSNTAPVRKIQLSIREQVFESEVINLEKEKADLLTRRDPRKNEESNALAEAIWAVHPGALWDGGPYCLPTGETRRTSDFAFTREYRYPDGTGSRSIHWGIDFGIPTGSSVTASGTGIVVLARERIVTGKTLVIEHFPGVYSLYYHLDKILVAEGSPVGAGDSIALSGSTGLATGPHLHWEFRINGEAMNPDILTHMALLDKDLFLSRIRGEN